MQDKNLLMPFQRYFVILQYICTVHQHLHLL